MSFEVYRCVQLNIWSVVCGCVLHRGRGVRGGVFRPLCVGMKLGWDFFGSRVRRVSLERESSDHHHCVIKPLSSIFLHKIFLCR